MNKPINGQLRVWWIPQLGIKGRFEVDVPNLVAAKVLLQALADYDLFQYYKRIKPDYSNAGGLVVWDEALDGDEKWTDWESPDNDDIDAVTLEQCLVFDQTALREAQP